MAETFPFQDINLPLEERVEDLVGRMTLPEKVAQTLHESPPIDHLGIPGYNWWNECLHGVARAGVATVFPQAIGLAATWNVELMGTLACVISDEGRAKHHEAARKEERGIYQGLTFWTPNINIFRDPRWGRGQETYGECPFLTGRLGVAFVKNLQGDDPKYLKAVATPKHYAVHSGPESERHHFDAKVSEKELRETYLPAFRDCVIEGGAWSVMGAYNRTNGEPCCASPTLLQEILRDEWGFQGYVVSDCGAICDIHEHHKVTKRPPESAALAVSNGCDLNCGKVYENLLLAVEEGLISEEQIDVSVRRLMTARLKLGMFDPPEQVPYAKIRPKVNDCSEHRQLALRAARESMVLLKNSDGCLPLTNAKHIAVLGPNADNAELLLGNYFGEPSSSVTILEGIQRRAEAAGAEVSYVPGCGIRDRSQTDFAQALEAVQSADVIIAVLGNTPKQEGEEGDAADSDGGGDRVHLDMPGSQQAMLEAVAVLGKPVVLVLTGGSPLAITWADEHVPAILMAWYPGEEGGTAVADVLFGDYNPAGRLPITFVKSLEQLPDFRDYRMQGRTYRFMQEEPLYPFGFGMSYTTFHYSNLRLGDSRVVAGLKIDVSVDVTNMGEVVGDEVVQLYVSDVEASVPVPVRELRGLRRIHLEPGETQVVSFRLTPRQLALIDREGQAVLESGKFIIAVGGCQPGGDKDCLGPEPCLTTELVITGGPLQLKY